MACGGFQANAEWRTRYLGAGWDLAKVRGTRYNTGSGIRMALDAGAGIGEQLAVGAGQADHLQTQRQTIGPGQSARSRGNCSARRGILACRPRQ